MKYKKHKRRETSVKQHRLTLPTCKLEMPDVIPGYPNENFPSSDSAYESSTDCGSDALTNQPGKPANCGHHRRFYQHPYQSLTTPSASLYSTPVTENNCVSNSHSDYLTSSVAHREKSPATHHTSVCHSSHHKTYNQRASLYQDGLGSLKIPSPHMRSHSSLSSLSSQGVSQMPPLGSHLHPATTLYSQHPPPASTHTSPVSHKSFQNVSPQGHARKQDSFDKTLSFPLSCIPRRQCPPDGLQSQCHYPKQEQNPVHFVKMKTELNHNLEQSHSFSVPAEDFRSKAHSEVSECHQLCFAFNVGKLQVKQEIGCLDDRDQLTRSASDHQRLSEISSSKVLLNTLTVPSSPQNSHSNTPGENVHYHKLKALQQSPDLEIVGNSLNSSYTFKLPPSHQPQQNDLSKNRSAAHDNLKNVSLSQPTSSLSFYPSPSSLISDLAKNDCLLSIVEDYQIEQFTGTEETVAQALCQVGDNIVMRFVQWMKQLPFYRYECSRMYKIH